VSNFESAVQIHLKTIVERDLAAFAEFLDPAHNCILILPNGNVIEGYEDIINFHEKWFQDLDWRQDVKIIDIFTIENIGYVLLDAAYQGLDKDKNPYELKHFFSLLFRKVGDKWILIRDQNTLK